MRPQIDSDYIAALTKRQGAGLHPVRKAVFPNASTQILGRRESALEGIYRWHRCY